MPPRLEQELDPVTLHNQALTHFDTDPTGGFEKLNFLIGLEAEAPQEALGNLLLLYVKYEYLDLAADLVAERGGGVELGLGGVNGNGIVDSVSFYLYVCGG